jgi:hypothetical protein
MKSMEIKNHRMQGSIMVERDHDGNDEDSLFEQKIVRSDNSSHTYKAMATNNLETLIPWSC